MSIIPRANQAPEYLPGGDDYLKEYIREINEPKQQQEAPIIPGDDDFEGEQPEIIDNGPSKYQERRGNRTAKFAVTTLDKIISSMMAVYAQSDTVEEFQADPDDIDDMAEQWGVYFTESNLDLPPWVFALITTGFVMMKKFKAAGSMRDINIERRKFKKENETLKNQLAILKAKNEMLELKKQVEKLETQIT